MTVTYVAGVKDDRMQAVLDAMDIGTNAILEIGTAAMASVLATFTLDLTSGVVSAGVLTISGLPKTVAASATGVAAEARIRTSAAADVITGLTVGTAATDIIIDNTSINSGQNVNLNSGTITHAA